MWVSFLIAGAIAGLQGYSFAKLGARYPTAGGMLEYVAKGFGNGHFGRDRGSRPGSFDVRVHHSHPEPASMVTLGVILVLSADLDFGWKRVRGGRMAHVQVGH